MSPHPHQRLLLSVVLSIAIPVSVECISFLVCVALMASDVELLLMSFRPCVYLLRTGFLNSIEFSAHLLRLEHGESSGH